MAGTPTPPPPTNPPTGGELGPGGAIDITPILEGLLLVYGILDLAGILPDPIALLESLFAGRPREQATIQVAQRLLLAQNPTPKILGIELLKALRQFDLVISETGSGREILNDFAAQFTAGLVAQGVPLTRAQTILTNAYSTAAQAGAPLEPELKAPLAQGLSLYGPSSFQSAYAQGELQAFNDHLTGNAYNNAVLKYVLTNQPISALDQIVVQQTNLNTTIPVQPINPGGGTIPITNPTPTPAPQPVTYTGPDPDGDEITYDLCLQLGTYFQQLQQALQGNPTGTGTTPTVDLTAVVAALGNIVTALGTIALNISELTGGTATPVDLTPVVGPLNALVTAVQAMAPAAPVDLTAVTAALDQIAAKIPATGVDTTGIVNAINAQTKEFTVDKPIGDALAAQGFIDADIAQLIPGGETGDWSLAGLSTTLSSFWRGIVLGAIGYDIKTHTDLTPGATARIGTWVATYFGKYLATTDKLIAPLLNPLITTIKQQVAPAATPALGASGVADNTAIQSAIAVALTAQVGAMSLDYLGYEIGESTKKIGEIAAAAVGYEELKEVEIGPLVRHGIAKVADMNARSLFQQEIPGVGEITGLVARGLLNQNTASLLLGWNGLHTSLRAQVQAGAYSGMNPRMLLQLIQTDLFTQGDLVDELTFAGIRPASQNRLLTAAPWIATKGERDQLRSALEQAYIGGILSDAQLTQQLDGLDQNTDRDALVLQRVQLEKQLAFTKDLAASYRQEYIANVFSAAQYENFLQGIGLQQDFINTRLAVDQAHAVAIATRKAAAEAAALAKATASVERQAAEKNFMAGNIDLAALTAALVASGLSAVQAAAWSDLAALRKAGGLRWTYGVQLAPVPAALLRARVSALSDQRKSGVLTDQALFAQLTALGIPQPFLNTIRADANAMIAAKAGAVLIPVDTGQ